jgi:hypothetical protein
LCAGPQSCGGEIISTEKGVRVKTKQEGTKHVLEFGPSAQNQIKRGSAGSRPKRFHIHSVPRDFQFVHLISPHLSDRACLSYF